jgi:shikimate kinase
VLLIGLRGSGKSTVGRLLARRLSVPFVDLDDATPRELGYATVADAWRAASQEAFRRAEVRALERLLREPGHGVIALGGGTPTAPGAARLIDRERAAGGLSVVYLRLQPDELRERMRAQPEREADRPSLTGADPLDEVDRVFQERDALYCRLSDWVVTESSSAEEAAARIAAEIAPDL